MSLRALAGRLTMGSSVSSGRFLQQPTKAAATRLAPATHLPTVGHNGFFPTGLLGGATWSIVRTFASKKHKNLLKFSKGYRGRSKNCFRIAIRRVHKAWQNAYRDRRRKKREWRKLWIQRIQAGVRQYGTFNYSRFVPALAAADIRLNRKVLAELAANEPFSFKSVVDTVEMTAARGDHPHLYTASGKKLTATA